ncbi:MAG TPA: phenylalanine racemase [Crenotrichaceae bacterium]|nr:phenylalanine racemase [Crenotrichaceae bacterium]
MNLVTGIEHQCITNPFAIAIRENQRAINYQQLSLKIGAVVQLLQRAGIPSGSRIGLAMDRGLDTVCVLLGVLSAGCCYVPLDIKSPAKRRQFIVNDAGVAAVIGCGECPHEYQNFGWLDYNSVSDHELDVSIHQADQLATILYTSGSTGSPKGVALSHRAIHAFSHWAQQLVNLRNTDCIASLTPLFFDLSTFDIFASLSTGACIDFVPAQLTMAPSQLSAWLSQHRISGFYTVPSVLGFLALKGNLEKTPLQDLRFVLFAGEVFPTRLLKTLINYLPNTEFYNFYGPTETNVCVYWRVEPDTLLEQTPIPIGHPACGNQLKIAENTGELLVKGPTVMSGYWSKKTLHAVLADQQWYATGDQVSINEKGEYCYHGRLDRMLKCSGYRVEPAEIEHVLLSLPEVTNCAVIGVSDETAGQRPAAAVVLQPETTIQALRRKLSQQLPHYMIPSRWKILPALPLLKNGKTDYLSISNLFVTAK